MLVIEKALLHRKPRTQEGLPTTCYMRLLKAKDYSTKSPATCLAGNKPFRKESWGLAIQMDEDTTSPGGGTVRPETWDIYSNSPPSNAGPRKGLEGMDCDIRGRDK